MKVIIQNVNTQLYPTPEGEWTADAEKAEDYRLSMHATAMARRMGLKNFDVFFFFPDLGYQVPAIGTRANDHEDSAVAA